MNANDLAASAASDTTPPDGISDSLRALWLAKAGRWDAAHDLCQEIPGNAGSWIHAYLHREEGDIPNSHYWYDRAGKPTPPAGLSLAEEWFQIVTELGR